MIYTCSRCNKTFSNKSNLVRHEKKHDTKIHKELFKCSDCGKTFKEIKTFNRHKTTHEHRFPCTQCDSEFVNLCSSCSK